MFMLKNDHFLFFLLYPLRLLVFLLITIISVEIVAVSSQSIDLRFEACSPRHCGNGVNISYPFWIDGIHQDYCGYPEFKVTCKNGEPVLHSSGNDYIIRDIFYEKQSFRVENSVGKDSEFDSCPSPLQNSTASIPPFKLGPNVVNLSFFYNCTIDTTYFPNGTDPNFTFYPKNCKYTDSQHFSFVMPSVPGNLDYWNSRCKTLVLVPVEVGGGREFSTVEPMIIDRSNYTLLLENGFLLEWNKTDCEQCQESGGYCGFDKEVLMCFCVDRPYPNRCNDDGKPSIYHQVDSYQWLTSKEENCMMLKECSAITAQYWFMTKSSKSLQSMDCNCLHKFSLPISDLDVSLELKSSNLTLFKCWKKFSFVPSSTL